MNFQDGNFKFPDENENILKLAIGIENLALGKDPEIEVLKDYMGIDKILVILLDGVGYSLLKEYACKYGYPEPRKITTIYPSTTAAVLTSLATTSKPGWHGMLDWNLYIPEIDTLIESIPFRPIGSRGMDTLKDMGYNIRVLFKGRRMFVSLKKGGFNVKAYLRGHIVNTCYSKYLLMGAERVPYINVTDLSVKLRKHLGSNDNTKVYYVYIEAVDAIAHKYGYYTEEQITDLKYTLYIIKNELIDKLSAETAKNILLILTSDHGLVTINPKEIIYLDKVEGFKKYLRRDSRGVPLVSGSPRNIYLHVKDEYLDNARRVLEEKLSDKAVIMDKAEFIKTGLLGRIRKKFLDRIGDLVLLPDAKFGIWIHHVKGKTVDIYGFHGGLSNTEIETGLIISRLSELK